MVQTFAFLITMFSRGIRTWVKHRNPLSIVSKPNFGPMSPTVIPVSSTNPSVLNSNYQDNALTNLRIQSNNCLGTIITNIKWQMKLDLAKQIYISVSQMGDKVKKTTVIRQMICTSILVFVAVCPIIVAQ